MIPIIICQFRDISVLHEHGQHVTSLSCMHTGNTVQIALLHLQKHWMATAADYCNAPQGYGNTPQEFARVYAGRLPIACMVNTVGNEELFDDNGVRISSTEVYMCVRTI